MYVPGGTTIESHWTVAGRPELQKRRAGHLTTGNPSLTEGKGWGLRTGRSGAFKLANAASRIGGATIFPG
jgi:hypothetical protein